MPRLAVLLYYLLTLVHAFADYFRCLDWVNLVGFCALSPASLSYSPQVPVSQLYLFFIKGEPLRGVGDLL